MKALANNKPLLAMGVYLGLVLGLLMLVLPDLQSKIAAQKNDTQVSFAVDWEDIAAFSKTSKPKDVMGLLGSVPVQYVVMPSFCTKEEEGFVRSAGYQVLWRLDDDVRPLAWLVRFQKGDMIFLAGEHVLEHPLLAKELPSLLREKEGYLCAMEFYPDRLLPMIAKQAPERVVKSHVLPTREMLYPKTKLWHERLVRAVKERWVRLLVIRFSPAMEVNANLDFQSRVAHELMRQGFSIGAADNFPMWESARTPSLISVKWRLWLVLVISVLTPVFLILSARAARVSSPWLVFLAMNAVTLFSGVVIHALGSVPSVVLGFQMMRGVKLQLVLPLAICGLLLCSYSEIKGWLDKNIKFKHVFFGGVFLVGLLGLYLMRSGNFPVIPVTDAERHLRDIMEHLFTARPRFKEFLIGQPLLLLGLLKRGEGDSLFTDGRLLLWLGLIGQISILNTFTHFHSPFDSAVVRSLHGVWVGCFVALPFVPWIKR